MKPKVNRPIRSTVSQGICICLALNAFVFGAVVGAYAVCNGLTTGRVYSLAVVIGDSTMVERSSSPETYWTTIGLYIFGCAAGIVLTIGILREVVTEHKRKVAAQKKNGSEPPSQG